MPSFAVLLAAFNGEKWITKQIESILTQKNVDVHLYVSIDVSTDNTYKLLDTISEKYTNITVLYSGKKFGGAALNFYYLILNVPVEEYDYIALSDQDDIWLENKLSKAISMLETQNAFGYSSDITAFWENGKQKTIKKSHSQKGYDYLFEGPGPGCSFVLKKELMLLFKKSIKACPFLKNIDWHDWLIYAYSRASGYKWIIDNCSYIMYRQHNNNQLGANFGWTAFSKRIKDVSSGYAINQTIVVVKFLHFENNPFVKKWYKNGKIDYLKLLCSTNRCRRSIKDRFFFFIACIVMLIIKPQLKFLNEEIYLDRK